MRTIDQPTYRVMLDVIVTVTNDSVSGKCHGVGREREREGERGRIERGRHEGTREAAGGARP